MLVILEQKDQSMIRRFLKLLSASFSFCGLALASMASTGKIDIGAEDRSWKEAANRIDDFIAEDLEEAGLERNSPVADEIFARRIYLDIVGRIPAYSELRRFLESKSSNKRSELIDQLLDSEGYVSSYYNFWADILRVKSRGRRTIMVSYQDWIKDSLRENKPYDDFVRELITAEGYVWDDPAVGYYLRDAGMPLDNMSNTAQIFLGTRMQCAQCHDHPFDKWTQKEYYHMAAYTFGLQAQIPYGKVPISQDFQKIQRGIVQKSLREGYTREEARARARPSAAERRVVRDLIQPMTAQALETERALRLPEDYQYENGKPKEKIAPATPFGKAAAVSNRDDPREVYADWMVSPENPRFTMVIANRLWKKVMGVGLIEPVDNLTDDTLASNPELMEYLETVMVDSEYDLKAYLRILYNTRTYQSAVSSRSQDPGEIYHFQGPVLRRMTAEQLWDSILTLAVVDLDERVGIEPQMLRARVGEEQMKARVNRLEDLTSGQIYGAAKRLTELETQFLEYEKQYREDLNNASGNKERNELRADYRKARAKKNQAADILLAKLNGEDTSEMLEAFNGSGSTSMGMGLMEIDAEELERVKDTRRDPRWRGVSAGMVRASEVISPAPPGHFLREFGQSDREIIGSSTDEASISQALRLLNGEALGWIMKPNSALNSALQNEARGERRMEIVFQSFFSRPVMPSEWELIGAQFEEYGTRNGYRQLLAALLNTQEFRFVQ